jgi:CarboxypepD_reg-like domain
MPLLVLVAVISCTLGMRLDAQIAEKPVGIIRGQVVEARTSAPLPAVLVQVESTRQRAVSDVDGRFEISAVPPGPQTVLVSVVGFGLVRRDVFVTATEATELTIPVAEGASTYVEDVAVTASRFRDAQPGVASQSVLGSRELLALRGLIADDPFRAVHVLPGVAASDDYRAEFAVRGLGPNHVGLSIDEVDSPLLFHTVRDITDTGSLALINSDILEDATLLSGTHPQVLGSHLGGRLDFRTRDGAQDRLHVRALISGSAATSVWEGPFGDGTRGSWLVAGRKSYIDWLLRRVDTSIEGAFGFADVQAKVTLQPTAAQTLRLSVIAGRSELDEDNEGEGVNTFDQGRNRTVIGNAQWRFTPSPKFAVTQQLYVVDSRYRNTVPDGRIREEGGDRDVTWRGGVEWSPASPHFFRIGGQLQALDADRIDRLFTSPTDAIINVDSHTDTSSRAGWVTYRWTPSSKIVISPGLRVEHWGIVKQTAASPWLLTEWHAGPSTRIRAGVGIQRQAPTLDGMRFVRSSDTIVAERARTIDVGVEQRIGESWRMSATAYHRRERDRLRAVNAEFRLVDGQIVRPVDPFIDNVLDGRARGYELTLERSALNGVSGWLSYGWGKAENTDRTTGETYWADWDQRHTLNANLTYRWSERSAISVRYRYGSNFPLQGYLAPSNGFHVLTSERNIARLPVYARLDVRADRAFTFRKSRLTLFAEVINVLDRDNFRAQGASLNLRTGVVLGLMEQLFPLLPSAGVLIEF